MSRLLSIFVQPEFEHSTTLKRHSDWCFLKYKSNIKNKKDNKCNPVEFNRFLISLQSCLICLFLTRVSKQLFRFKCHVDLTVIVISNEHTSTARSSPVHEHPE